MREHDLIAIEDLDIQGMTASTRGTIDTPGRKVPQKAGPNRSLPDAASGEFRRQSEYKAARAGRAVAVVDRWFPSGKTCSECGYLLANLRLIESQPENAPVMPVELVSDGKGPPFRGRR